MYSNDLPSVNLTCKINFFGLHLTLSELWFRKNLQELLSYFRKTTGSIAFILNKNYSIWINKGYFFWPNYFPWDCKSKWKKKKKKNWLKKPYFSHLNLWKGFCCPACYRWGSLLFFKSASQYFTIYFSALMVLFLCLFFSYSSVFALMEWWDLFQWSYQAI